MLAMLYTMWLPNELVVFSGKVKEPPQVVAYVLADDPGGSITLLDSVTRQILRFPDEDVASASACRLTPHTFWSDITDGSTPWAIVSKKVPPASPPTCSTAP